MRLPLPGGGRVLVFGVATASSGVPASWAATARRPGVNYLETVSPGSAGRLAGAIAPQRQPGDLVVLSIYASLPPVLHDPLACCERLAREIAHHEARLFDPQLAFPSAAVRPVCARCASICGCSCSTGATCWRRARAGRVVEGHGDLRPEHVWLGEPPAIIDCLEFSPELRTADSADELAFVALECERAGAAELGRVLLREFAALAGDAVPGELTAFYQGLRGCVRASIALWHLKEPRYRGSPLWGERAGQYLRLAAGHALDCTH